MTFEVCLIKNSHYQSKVCKHISLTKLCACRGMLMCQNMTRSEALENEDHRIVVVPRDGYPGDRGVAGLPHVMQEPVHCRQLRLKGPLRIEPARDGQPGVPEGHRIIMLTMGCLLYSPEFKKCHKHRGSRGTCDSWPPHCHQRPPAESRRDCRSDPRRRAGQRGGSGSRRLQGTHM